MRKLSIILITLIYASLSIGIHVHLHYCCGKLSEIHLAATTESCCEHEAHDNNSCNLDNHCCSNEEVNASINDEHQPSQYKLSFPTIANHTSHIADVTSLLLETHNRETIFRAADSDPPLNEEPVYIKYSSLLLYA